MRLNDRVRVISGVVVEDTDIGGLTGIVMEVDGPDVTVSFSDEDCENILKGIVMKYNSPGVQSKPLYSWLVLPKENFELVEEGVSP